MGIIFRFLSNLDVDFLELLNIFQEKNRIQNGISRRCEVLRTHHQGAACGHDGWPERASVFLPKKEQLHPPPHTYMHPTAATPPLICMTVKPKTEESVRINGTQLLW